MRSIQVLVQKLVVTIQGHFGGSVLRRVQQPDAEDALHYAILQVDPTFRRPT